MAYDRIKPLPDPYWCAALGASSSMQAMGARGVKLEDYIPRRAGVKRVQSAAEGLAKFDVATASLPKTKTKGE